MTISSHDSDKFDVKLDDDFVKGSSIKEKKLRRQQKRSQKNVLKFKRRRKLFRKPNQTELVGLVIAVALVAFAGDRVFRQHQAASAVQGVPMKLTPNSAATGSPTSTTVELTRRSYKVGDCVNWNQDAQTSADRPTAVVACSAPHLMEFAASTEMKNPPSTFPTSEEWNQIIDQQCGPLIQTFMGIKLDSHGIFYNGAIHPAEDAWAQGDRTLDCGVQFHDFTAGYNPNMLVSSTGEARGANQNPAVPKGSCWFDAPDTTQSGVVDCGQPHQLTMTGAVDVSSIKTFPSNEAAWSKAVGSKCDAAGRAYLGKPLTGPTQAGWFEIPSESWDLGDRSVDCFVGHWNGSNWTMVSTTA